MTVTITMRRSGDQRFLDFPSVNGTVGQVGRIELTPEEACVVDWCFAKWDDDYQEPGEVCLVTTDTLVAFRDRLEGYARDPSNQEAFKTAAARLASKVPQPLIYKILKPPRNPSSIKENKRSVYFGKSIQSLLDRCGRENVSKVINDAVAKYIAVVEDHRPYFSYAEWRAICAVVGSPTIGEGFIVRGSGYYLSHLIESMEEDRKIREDLINSMEKEWITSRNGEIEESSIDFPRLAENLENLTTAQSLAVMHVVDIYWAHRDLDIYQVLEMAGGPQPSN